MNEVIASLCENPRLQRWGSIRAAVCAIILMEPAAHDESFLTRLAERLALTTRVDLQEIHLAFARYIAVALSLWAMTPSELYRWLVARRALMLLPRHEPGGASANDVARNAARRNLVNHLCQVLRWVAAQCDDGIDDPAEIAACFAEICGEGWLALTDSDSRPSNFPETDPLLAEDCWLTAQWLSANKWLPPLRAEYGDEIRRAAGHEIRIAWHRHPYTPDTSTVLSVR